MANVDLFELYALKNFNGKTAVQHIFIFKNQFNFLQVLKPKYKLKLIRIIEWQLIKSKFISFYAFAYLFNSL